jgi:hypothetical protein
MNVTSVSPPTVFTPQPASQAAPPPPPTKVDSDGDHDGDTGSSKRLLDVKA